MHLRLAKLSDLPELKEVYKKIIEQMDKDNIPIWDEVYPCEFFIDDIENDALYVLTDEAGFITAAFALCESADGSDVITWEKPDASALYLYRLGVNVDFARQGIGSAALAHAAALAKQKNAEYLRLFVVDFNQPAIQLYLKNGFRQADGIYDNPILEDVTLPEYGFERRL